MRETIILLRLPPNLSNLIIINVNVESFIETDPIYSGGLCEALGVGYLTPVNLECKVRIVCYP